MINDLIGAAILMGYYLVILVGLPIILRAWTKMPKELVRKFQHVGYSMSIFIMVRFFDTWYMAIAAAFLLVILAYPVLILLERTPFYRRGFVDRTARGGELRRQLLLVQLTFALLIFIFWGLLGRQWHYLIPVAVMAWGFGDAAAALVGKFWGKRHVLHRWIEGAKTWEGTGAMIAFAAGAVFLTMFFYWKQTWYVSLLVAVIVAPLCGFTELFSRRGTDTITVPLAAALAIMPLVYFFSRLGW
ncbi:MAG: diacylglycerol/polyprenol kinase family protein [Bacillota bacterium]|jgi:phytol kinase